MSATNASPGTVEFLRRYYDAIDQQHPEEALACFAADATVRAVNEPPQPWMKGLQAMARQLRGVTGTRHAIASVVEGANGETAYEVNITYILESGTEVALAGAVFCVIRDDRFQHQHLYVDLTPVREAIAKER
jgi:ketosteroid isomerase-like protein